MKKEGKLYGAVCITTIRSATTPRATTSHGGKYDCRRLREKSGRMAISVSVEDFSKRRGRFPMALQADEFAYCAKMNVSEPGLSRASDPP